MTALQVLQVPTLERILFVGLAAPKKRKKFEDIPKAAGGGQTRRPSAPSKGFAKSKKRGGRTGRIAARRELGIAIEHSAQARPSGSCEAREVIGCENSFIEQRTRQSAPVSSL